MSVGQLAEAREKFTCKYCQKSFSHTFSLRRHAEKQHNIEQVEYPSVCIDQKNGIFAVAKAQSGVIAPIHVQKCIEESLIGCSSAACNDLMRSAARVNPSIECEHLESVKFAEPIKDESVDPRFLKKLSEINVISNATLENCLQLLAISKKNSVPLVTCLDFKALGYSGRIHYYSVYTNKNQYFCKFGRVRVSFDSESGEWSCECPLSTHCHACIHETVVKWYMAQWQPDILSENESRQVFLFEMKIGNVKWF